MGSDVSTRCCPCVVTSSAIAGDRHILSPDQADALAAQILGDQRTHMGVLAISHARRVAARVRRIGDDRTVAAALLHDVVATRQVTLTDIDALTGDDRLTDLVAALTRGAGESDRHYLARCAAEPIALFVKRADLADQLVIDDTSVPHDLALHARRRASRQLDPVATARVRARKYRRPRVPLGLG